MILNNSINNSFVSATLGPSYPYENYPDKKNLYKKHILVAASSSCINARIAKMTIELGIQNPRKDGDMHKNS